MEGSIETSGLHIVYILKSMILLFVVSTFLQGVSISLHSLLVIIGYEHLVEEELGEGV
jgi:TRAP-type mannitol/chloroaromatic compound transport system permease small subunit